MVHMQASGAITQLCLICVLINVQCKRNRSVIVKYYIICFLSFEGDCHGVTVMVKGSH